MFIFRIRVALSEEQFSSMRSDMKDSGDMNDELKNHIFQQIFDQIKNMDSNYY